MPYPNLLHIFIRRLSNRYSIFVAVLLYLHPALSQPVISSFSPVSATIGGSVIITGTNFSSVPSNNIVYFGAAKATVTAASAVSLTVTVPIGATHHRITVTVNGLSAYSSRPFNVVSGDPLTANSFSVRTTFTAGTYPSMLARGDLDNDGLPDMAVSNFSSTNISVFRNSSTAGTVSFAPAMNLITGVEPEGIIIDDINSDGKQDLMVTSISGHLFSVFINTGTAGTISFAPRADVFEGGLFWPRGITTGDIDGDGKTDVAVADNNKVIDFSNNTSYGTLSIHRNTGTGGNLSFAPFISFRTGEYPRSVVMTDLDGDGKADLAVNNFISDNVSVFRNNSSPGTIDLSLQLTIPVNGHAEQLTMSDLDGDGKADMIVTNLFGISTMAIFRNTSVIGSISFAARQDITGVAPLGLSAGDLDGDGKPDLGLANFSSNQVSVFKNTSTSGNISFAPKMDYNAGAGPIDVRIGDVDGDIYPDLTVSNSIENKVSVLRMAAAAPVLDLGADTSFCRGNSLILQANIPAATYLWSNGATSNTITVTQSGTYWVRVTTASIILTDTINITVKAIPLVTLGNDTTLCKGANLLLNAFNAGATYAWSNGTTSSSLNIASAGTYSVTIDLDGCVAKDTVIISYDSIPQFTFGPDAVLCKDKTIILNPEISRGNFTWQDGSSMPTFTVTHAGTYSLTVTTYCGSSNDEIVVMDGSCELLMPNAFTPNNDANNDVFNVKYPGFIKTFEMRIFNRWGEIVYQTKNKYEGWDGTYNGKPQPAGNYVWIISLTDIDNQPKIHKGYVLLIR